MALWLAALQVIPWEQVISNTPKLLAAAKKLLTRAKEAEPGDMLPDGVVVDDQQRLAYLETIVKENRRDLRELHERLEETAALLQSLSDQNAQLVGAIEQLRQRGKLLLAVAVVSLAGLAAYLVAR